MIPSIKCQSHIDEDIILIDVSTRVQRKNRNYCLECLSTITELQKTYSIKKVPEKTMEYAESISLVIKGEQSKIDQTLRQLNTLKENTLRVFDKLIQQSEEEQKELTKLILQEQEYYKELVTNMTEKNLQQIAEMLSGTIPKEVRSIEAKEQTIDLCGEIAINLKQTISDQQKAFEEINQICTKKMIKLSSRKQEYLCNALACHSANQMIVGNRGNELIIWQQNKDQLLETAVLQEHNDIINALVVYTSGDLIASGGEDKSIKLWNFKNNLWKCIHTAQEHKGRINDLQLTPKEDQLISASSDRLIMIWRLQQTKLECIQTLDEHFSCVYWISIRQDSQYMASSSSQSYFNLYKQEQIENNTSWKKVSKINTQGTTNRIFFVSIDQLLVQQVNPPRLMIYQQSQNQYQAQQVINLNQADNKQILFPMFQIRNVIYMKNDSFLYVIRRLKQGQYLIEQILSGCMLSGCPDSYGQGVFSWSFDNKSIDLYSI